MGHFKNLDVSFIGDGLYIAPKLDFPISVSTCRLGIRNLVEISSAVSEVIHVEGLRIYTCSKEDIT
jgi:hypothetical protein